MKYHIPEHDQTTVQIRIGSDGFCRECYQAIIFYGCWHDRDTGNVYCAGTPGPVFPGETWLEVMERQREQGVSAGHPPDGPVPHPNKIESPSGVTGTPRHEKAGESISAASSRQEPEFTTDAPGMLRYIKDRWGPESGAYGIPQRTSASWLLGYAADGSEVRHEELPPLGPDLLEFLGKASWEYDSELGCHIPCCSGHKWQEGKIVVCGNGPLTGEEIVNGLCSEPVHTLR